MKAIAAPVLLIAPIAVTILLAAASPLHSQFDTPLIDTRSSGTGTNLDQEMIQSLPQGRDPWSVLRSVPGIQPDRPAAQGVSGAMAASGNALITVDGIAIGDAAALGASSTYMDFDFIEEVQVQTGPTGSAEYGDAVGGVINVATKTGSREWQGTGRFLTDEDDPYGLRTVPDPRILIDILERETGDYCLNGVQLPGGGNPLPGGAGGPIQFGFDTPITIGVGTGSGTTFGAGATGNLNLAQIPGCPGQLYGLSFVDAPGPVTPPNPTHLAILENGVYAVDMGRVGLNYGLSYTRRSNSYKLEDTHPFKSDFYLTGRASYGSGGFQFVPQASAGQAAQGQEGFFLYGVDAGIPTGADQTQGLPPRWDFYTIRLGDAPSQLPDANGDGRADSYFLSLANPSACPNVLGGAFSAGAGSANGGTLEPDANAPAPDCEFLQDRIRMGDYFSLNVGLRYEDSEPSPAADYDGPFADMIRSAAYPTTGGVVGRYTENIGGPIIKDRLWFYGTYTLPEAAREEPRGSLFSDSFYESAPDYTQLFPHGFYTDESVQSAPGGRGVQEIGLEIQSQERAFAPGEDGPVPGGAMDGESRLKELADALDSPLIYVVANGGPTGEVFEVQIVHPESGPVAIEGIVAVEPVAATADDREDFEREIARAGGTREILTAAGYCLNQDLLPPPAGTVYRVAPAAKQAAFEPMRHVLDAARQLRDSGGLNPDSDPTDYYHSIRQWAVWTVEKGYDREGFLDAFVQRTEKNFHDSGQPWSADVAAAVRSYGEGRWSDIREILDAAEATS